MSQGHGSQGQESQGHQSGWHRLKVAAVIEETTVDKTWLDKTALDKTLVFDVPEALQKSFRRLPGQHLVVRRELGSETLLRCYSLSGPVGENPRITVRKIGRVSGDLHRLAEGNWLEVSVPCGSFTLETLPKAYRSHYFFAAGSAITPIFAMINAVLQAEPFSSVYLLYGNRSLDRVLFHSALDDLQESHGQRFHLTHSLTSPPWWSSFDGWTGRIDGEAVQAFVEQHPPVAQDAQYWVCGPGGMISTVRQALMAIDVPVERIHSESFGSPDASQEATVQGVASTLEIVSGLQPGGPVPVSVAADETLLDAMRRQGVQAPHACMAGVCSACRARLVEGEVQHKSTFALDDQELTDGFVLTCQAVARSEHIRLRFESP